MKLPSVSRREFLKTTLVGGAGLATGFTGFPYAAKAMEGDPIKILSINAVTGPYADTGIDVVRGIKLALEESGYKVLGRPIELIERDAFTPAEGMRKVKEGVEKEGAEIVHVGTISSTVYAVAEYCARNKVLCAAYTGGDEITGTRCNPYTFRWTIPTYGAAREVVPRMIKEVDASTFYTIQPKYAFGESFLQNVTKAAEENGKKVVGNSYHPIGETEYSGIITKAMSAKPDCVLFLNFAGDTMNSVKQAVNFGMKKRSTICMAYSAGEVEFQALGPDILEGTWAGVSYYHTIDNPQNKKAVAAYRKKYGVWMPYAAAYGYQQMRANLDAIKRAGSAKPDDVAKAWEGYRYQGLTGEEYFRKCDHQCIRPYYTVRLKSRSEMKDPEDFAEIVGSSVNFPSCEETGCRM